MKTEACKLCYPKRDRSRFAARLAWKPLTPPDSQVGDIAGRGDNMEGKLMPHLDAMSLEEIRPQVPIVSNLVTARSLTSIADCIRVVDTQMTV